MLAFLTLLVALAMLGALGLVARRRRGRRPDRGADLDAIRRAAGIGPAWEVIWTGTAARESFEHLCAGPAGPGDRYRGERVRLCYTPTAIPGVEVARCRHCQIAWVRSMGGGGPGRRPPQRGA